MPFSTLPSTTVPAGTIRPPIEIKGAATTAVDISLSGVNAELIPKTFTSTDVWEVIDSAQGSGSISFCAVEQSTNASNRSIDARLVLDGNIVWTKVAGWVATGDSQKAIALIGYKEITTDSSAAFDYVRFNRGWSLQVRATSAAGSVTMNGYIRSQRES